MAAPPVVPAQQWQQARERLLVKEKELTRALDALAAKRRRLPMVAFDQRCVFDGPDGPVTLVDVFDGRRQLIVYHFMDLGPEQYCAGSSAFIDNVGRLGHLNARDTSFAVVSTMPRPQIAAHRQRMGWAVPCLSCHGSSFSVDYGVEAGFGMSVFLRNGADVYRTYFTTSRGVDRLRFDVNVLDLTAFARQEEWEDSPPGWPQMKAYQWWRLHDEYDS
jgi:predicted dithiol-disulfide oxidoreductase (DUF899 family)